MNPPFSIKLKEAERNRSKLDGEDEARAASIARDAERPDNPLLPEQERIGYQAALDLIKSPLFRACLEESISISRADHFHSSLGYLSHHGDQTGQIFKIGRGLSAADVIKHIFGRLDTGHRAAFFNEIVVVAKGIDEESKKRGAEEPCYFNGGVNYIEVFLDHVLGLSILTLPEGTEESQSLTKKIADIILNNGGYQTEQRYFETRQTSLLLTLAGMSFEDRVDFMKRLRSSPERENMLSENHLPAEIRQFLTRLTDPKSNLQSDPPKVPNVHNLTS